MNSLRHRCLDKQYLAPGFLDRLNKICKHKGIAIEQLADIAQVDPDIFQYYDSGEIKIDELTLHRILEYSDVDWMWLEHGYEPEDLEVIGNAEMMGVEYEC